MAETGAFAIPVKELENSASLSQAFDESSQAVREDMESMRQTLKEPHMEAPRAVRKEAETTAKGSSGSQLRQFIEGLCAKHAKGKEEEEDGHDEPFRVGQEGEKSGEEKGEQQESTPEGLASNHNGDETSSETSENHTAPSANQNAEWEKVSRMLRESGFQGLEEDAPPEEQIEARMREVLRQLRRKQDVAEKARKDADEQRKRAGRMGRDVERLEREKGELEKDAGKKQLRAETRAEKSSDELHRAKEEARKLKQTESQLQGRVEHLEHTCKAKDKELDSLREKLQAKVDAEERRASRDKEAFSRIQQQLAAERRHGSPRNAASTFSPGDIVSAYESHKEKLEQELADARRDAASLRQELKRLGADTSSEQTRQSHHPEPGASDPNATPSPTGSTREQMRRDKKDTKLQLGAVDDLSHATLVSLVKDACRRLELSDACDLGSAVQKLQKLGRAVPKLEGFVKEVCGTVEELEKREEDPKRVPEIVKGYGRRAKQADELDEFRDVVARELRKCSKPIVRQSGSIPELASAVADLVQIEREYEQAREAFADAERAMESGPDEVIRAALRHFMRLFGVGTVEGAVPEMNRVHVRLGELESFLRTACSLVGLDPPASPEKVTSRLRHLLGPGRFDDSQLLHDYRPALASPHSKD